MVDTYYRLEGLEAALASGQLILTANSRLCNHLLRAQLQAQGAEVLRAPRVLTLQQWADERWQKLQQQAWAPSLQAVASGDQRLWLWQQIIQNSSLTSGLLQPAPLAQDADAALRALELWQLDEAAITQAEPQLSQTIASNSQSFLIWLGEFRARLASLDLITQEQSLALIIQATEAGLIAQESSITLVGFDDLPPLHQALINSSCQQLVTHRKPDRPVDLKRTQCSTPEAEMLAAALWAKTKLMQNPQAMIGIIVPNLGQCREPLERVFTQVFEPLAPLPSEARFTLPFNFSAGTPLASCPLIATGLELLRLYQSHWPLAEICHLLQSPFWGQADAELFARSQLIDALQNLGRFEISASDLRYQAQKLATALDDSASEHLSQVFIHLETQRRTSFGQQPLRYWREQFERLLTQLNWPGERRLDSQEHQQLTLWQQLLDEFVELDSCQLQLNYSQALAQLRNTAGKTPFQAQTPLSPIQILGALEGAGLDFSHCWVLGLHHRQWPAAPSPNPLLPISLQRQQRMPHASAERERLFAESLTAQYRQCAAQVVFSSASHSDDQELSPSALIRSIPLTPLEQLVPQLTSDAQLLLEQIIRSRQLEILEDHQGPAIGPTEIIRGGASIFKEQAACPFNAFARLRLGAWAPDAPVPGFSALERGNMLHDALARIWRALGDQATLLGQTDEQLTQLINESVRDAVTSVKTRRGFSLSQFYAELEQERLINLIGEWLAAEKRRPPFKVIAIEEALEVSFAGLPLKLRLDRVDQLLHTNQLLLIDYKTGQPSTKSWLSDRPEEPQLPLYALINPQPASAIAFAQINARAMAWKGSGELEVQHEGIEHIDWGLQRQEWQQVLTRLAEEFLSGDARVDFKDAKAQQYAEELVPLNRILERETIEKLKGSF